MKKLIIAIVLISTAAVAQQQSPGERALGQKLLAELNSSLQCSTALISAQDQIAALQAKVKELEEKAKTDAK